MKRFFGSAFGVSVLACGFALGCGASAEGGRGFSPFKFLDFARQRPAIHAMLINGGDNPQRNYQSHLLHIKEVVDYLLAAGVPRRNIVIFASDGADPEPDLAVRDRQPEREFWLIEGLPVGNLLQTQIRHANSTVGGFALRAATQERIREWIVTEGSRLRPGDTLLLYVTDHGSKNEKDANNNSIVLWGEKLSVAELREMLALLPVGVRVVSLMSQCYSGAFANASFDRGDGEPPSGAVCGYFSTTPERFAYGCYPENLGKKNIGHSFRFIEAMRSSGEFPEAHRRVLVTDRTPDVPNRSSDFYIGKLIESEAQRQGKEPEAFVDELLDEAWRARGRYEREIRLLDRIGETFGSFSPRSLAELEAQAKDLPELSEALRTYADRWKAAFQDLKAANFDRFLRAHPSWRERLQATRLKELKPQKKRSLARRLLADLVKFTNKDHVARLRLDSLRSKARQAREAGYRMEVRLGVVLRMRSVLTSVAGQVFLDRYASREEREAYERLAECEDLSLRPVTQVARQEPPAPVPFPPLADEVALVERVLPGWLGIQFRQVSAESRTEKGLPAGAVAVLTVYPDSPARSAGLSVGDIILGPPGAHFVEPNEIREWTMTSSLEAPTRLEILRDGRREVVSLKIGKFPVRLPSLPGPPKVGSVAPKLKLGMFRGQPPRLGNGKRNLLFFWATWCAICKAALPELVAFEQATGTRVIAVTDEPKGTLTRFFREFEGPFPHAVAMDELRQAFLGYGVSGTPTFVLVDEDGKVAFYATGYSPAKGLGMPGWRLNPPR